jgi:drug/metabolite transporter (DMT)-like permease
MKNLANKIRTNSPFNGPSGKAYFALSWVSIFWGTTWLASRLGVTNMPALQLIGMRQFLAGAIFVAYFLFKKHPLPKGRQWNSIIILSILNFVFSNGFVIWGVRFISSGLGAIIGAIFPLWLVMIGIFQGKKLSPVTLTGMLLGFGGVCIIFYDHLKDFLNAGFRFGIAISLFASLTWAFGALYTKHKAESFNPYFSLGFQMLISSIVFLGVSYGTGDVIPITKIPMVCFWSIMYLVIIGTCFTFVAYIYCLQKLPTSLISIYAYINPIVAVILGAVVLHEKLNGYIAVGGVVTLLGVFLVNYSYKNALGKS